MRKKLARRLANKLIKIHCPDYKLAWINSSRKFGHCHWGTKTIALSAPLVKLNAEKEVLDTILHEIAHAVTHQGHNKIFYRKCKELGARPKRCYSSEEVIVPKRNWYVYTCISCNEEILRRGQLKKSRAHGKCCKRFNHNRYSPDYELKLTGRKFK